MFVFCIGGTQAIKDLAKGLNLKTYSENPISPNRLFEVVSDDLQTLNKNLLSVSSSGSLFSLLLLLTVFEFLVSILFDNILILESHDTSFESTML